MPARRGGRPRHTKADPPVPIDGARVKALMMELGWTERGVVAELSQRKLARVSAQVIHQIVSGQQKTTRTSVRRGLATFFGVAEAVLMPAGVGYPVRPTLADALWHIQTVAKVAPAAPALRGGPPPALLLPKGVSIAELAQRVSDYTFGLRRIYDLASWRKLLSSAEEPLTKEDEDAFALAMHTVLRLAALLPNPDGVIRLAAVLGGPMPGALVGEWNPTEELTKEESKSRLPPASGDFTIVGS